MGRTLGLLWAEKGHEVFFGSRNERDLQYIRNLSDRSFKSGSLNEAVQFGVALVIVTPVICNVCPLLAAVRFAEVKLAAPEPLATTPVTGVCATALIE